MFGQSRTVPRWRATTACGAKGPFDRLASTAMSMPAQRGTGYANEGAVAGLVMVLVGLLNVLAAPLLAKLLN